MATSTYMTFLMHQITGKSQYEKLLDITEFPDLGTDPEMLETTTTSDRMQTFILGIQGNEALNFNANYDHAEYLALKALERKKEQYAVWFGGVENPDGTVTPTGNEGRFSFGGELSVRVTGGGVNEVRGMGITIAPNTIITPDGEMGANVAGVITTDISTKYGKTVDELVKDANILEDGSVIGTFLYVTNFEKFSPGDEELCKGHFFPLQLGKEYEGKPITVQRISGKDGKAKTSEDTDWILKLTDEADTVYSIKADGVDELVLNFALATLKSE